MAIKEKGYSKWEGELSHAGLHWLPIFWSGIRTVWKKKYAKLTFYFAIMPFIYYLIGIWAISKPELKMFAGMVRGWRSDAVIFNGFFSNGFTALVLIILAIFTGSELISLDLRTRALPLYFARPLTKVEYLAGKFSIMLFYLLLFSLVPGVILFLAKLIFTGSVSFAPRLLFGIFIFPLITATFLTSMTLGFSILSANTRLIRILIIIVFFISNSIAESLVHMLHSDYFYLLSIPKNLIQLGHLTFGSGDKWDYPPILTLAVMLGLTLFFCSVLYFKVRKVEAQS